MGEVISRGLIADGRQYAKTEFTQGWANTPASWRFAQTAKYRSPDTCVSYRATSSRRTRRHRPVREAQAIWPDCSEHPLDPVQERAAHDDVLVPVPHRPHEVEHHHAGQHQEDGRDN
jgi:hypothetical protein